MKADKFGGAQISECRQYRYRLWRRWGFGPQVLWIMLNPSTADARVDDPTIRRVAGFTKSWGCDGFTVMNLYALRATDPRKLRQHDYPGGPGNGDILLGALRGEWRHVVVAWGAAANPEKEQAFIRLAKLAKVTLECLGTTNAGHPRHPLYLPKTQQLEPWPAGI